jgi:hypothetical protein
MVLHHQKREYATHAVDACEARIDRVHERVLAEERLISVALSRHQSRVLLVGLILLLLHPAVVHSIREVDEFAARLKAVEAKLPPDIVVLRLDALWLEY